MCKMYVYQWLVVVFLLFKDVFALKNVVFTIQPPIVRRWSSATLICLYDLEKANLYSVKWYRGSHEFYKFMPSEEEHTKIFPVHGVNVDISRSNSTQVVITDIDFHLSGNFSCEVTTAELPVATDTKVQPMLVVQLPEFPPTISVGREPLDYGDVLRANCSSPAARPPARLKFFLNDLLVASSPKLTPRQSLENLWSDLSLNLPLQEYHFRSGRLILRCVSEVEDIYHEEAVLELASARNPVPEKVSALDSASGSLSHVGMMVALFFFIARI